MPARHALPITFAVPGRSSSPERGTRSATAAPLPAGLTTGRVTHAVRIVATRGAVAESRISATPGRDVVVLTLAGGPALVLHPETARDLLLAQGPPGQAPEGRSRRGRASAVPIPARLQWRSAEAAIPTRGGARGWLGDVLLSAVDVVTDLSLDSAAAATAAALAKHVDGGVEAGVHALEATALRPLKGRGLRRDPVPASTDGGPTLVLVHGTFSDTCGTFSKLWTQHPSLVQALFAGYRGRVFGLDHPTLTASPVANALMLASALPPHTRLHLMTHSRGGLVADVLARAAGGGDLDVSAFGGSDHRTERQHLQQLIRIVREKAIRVERVVRVACPARGTLLASRRLDAFLSVFKWSLDLAGVPVAPRFIDFLAAVAKRRTDPAELPGLAAQMPDSPLVQWLHETGVPVDGDLRVVAGDLSGDSVTSWLKTLVTDAFYWTDHDLVVQTRSMYGGTPRRDRPTFVLDHGAQVSHFGYFANERTAGAIVSALLDARPSGFRPIGALSQAGTSSTGTRAVAKPARGKRTSRAATRPAVLLVPPVSEVAAALSPHFDVIDFPADWSAPVEDEAGRLATIAAAALDARRGRRQPVHLLAYSFGAIIARTLQLERPAVWKRLLAHPNARVLLLAPPNRGTWSPMQLLSGDDPFGERMASFAAPHGERAARDDLAQSVGLLQQQAGWLDPSLGLAHRETWQNLAEADLERSVRHSPWHSTPLQVDALRWGVPSQAVIDRAVALRRRLDAQQDGVLPGIADRLRVIVGRSNRTTSGVELTPTGVVYLDVLNAGDGRVTLESAALPGVRTWIAELDHGRLPHDSAVAAACLDLIQRGDTSHLAELETAPAVAFKSAERLRSRPGRSKPAAAPERAADVYVVDDVDREPQVPGAALRISVVNGDLSFVSNPLLIGHYRSMRLTGTESVINRLIGGAMSDSLATGVYPDAPGSHRIFINRVGSPGTELEFAL